MNILLVGNYPSQKTRIFTGPMRVLYCLARSLSQVAGISVTVVTPHRMRHIFKKRNILHRENPSAFQMGYFPFIKHTFFNKQYDVINIHGVSFFNLLPLYAPRYRKRPKIIYTAHGVIPLETGLGYAYNQNMRAFEKRLITQSDYLTTVSEDTKRYLVEFYHIPADNITVIENGVDIDLFKPEAGDRIVRLKKRINLLFVGDMIAIKGLDFLLSALTQLTHDSFQLWLVGRESSHLQTLKEKYKALFQSNKVIFKGPMPQNRLIQVYQAADVYLLTSQHETFSQTVLEAMAMAKPIIISDRVGVQRIISDGKEGYIVPFNNIPTLADRISKLIDNHELRSRMGAAARKLAEKNTWTQIADRYGHFFRYVKSKAS